MTLFNSYFPLISYIWPFTRHNNNDQVIDNKRDELYIATEKEMNQYLNDIRKNKRVPLDRSLSLETVINEREALKDAKRMELLMRAGIFLVGFNTAYMVSSFANFPKRYIPFNSLFMGSGITYWHYKTHQIYVHDEYMYSLPLNNSLLKEYLIFNSKREFITSAKESSTSFLNSPLTKLQYKIAERINSKNKVKIYNSLTPKDSLDTLIKYIPSNRDVLKDYNENINSSNNKFTEDDIFKLLISTSKSVDKLLFSTNFRKANMNIFDLNSELNQNEKDILNLYYKNTINKIKNYSSLI